MLFCMIIKNNETVNFASIPDFIYTVLYTFTTSNRATSKTVKPRHRPGDWTNVKIASATFYKSYINISETLQNYSFNIKLFIYTKKMKDQQPNSRKN